MNKQVTVTDEMVNACYNYPDRVPEGGKRLMRQTLERALLAGGYTVLHQYSADEASAPTVAEIEALQAYADWAWKMSRSSGLDLSVFDQANTTLARNLKESRGSPDAVFISNIATEREWELLYNWSYRMFGHIEVGGGQRPNHTWWVHITHSRMKAQGFEYPTKKEKQ